MVTFNVAYTNKETMSKSTNFSGQPIFNQLIKFIDKGDKKRISKVNKADRCVKKFSTIIMLL